MSRLHACHTVTRETKMDQLGSTVLETAGVDITAAVG